MVAVSGVRGIRRHDNEHNDGSYSNDKYGDTHDCKSNDNEYMYKHKQKILTGEKLKRAAAGV